MSFCLRCYPSIEQPRGKLSVGTHSNDSILQNYHISGTLNSSSSIHSLNCNSFFSFFLRWGFNFNNKRELKNSNTRSTTLSYHFIPRVHCSLVTCWSEFLSAHAELPPLTKTLNLRFHFVNFFNSSSRFVIFKNSFLFNR